MIDILGLDGTEVVVKAKYKTFCNLCNRQINKDEEVYSWNKSKFLIHIDCEDPEVKQRMTNYEFRKNVKRRKRKSVKTGGKRDTSKPEQYRKNWY